VHRRIGNICDRDEIFLSCFVRAHIKNREFSCTKNAHQFIDLIVLKMSAQKQTANQNRAAFCTKNASADAGGIARQNSSVPQNFSLEIDEAFASINLASKYIFLMYLDFAAKAALNASCVCINPTMFIAGLIAASLRIKFWQ